MTATLLLKKPPKPEKDENGKYTSNILYLSVSKVKSFESCKSKYKFAYIDKVAKAEKSYLIFGKFLHEVLEIFHKAYIEKKSTNEFNVEMTNSFKLAFENWKEKIDKSQFDEAKLILSSYLIQLNKEKNDNILPTFLAAEQEFYIDIDNKILLNGFIDRVQLDHDDVLHVSDYKTSTKSKYLEKDHFQLLTYAFVMSLKYPEIQKFRTSYIMLRDNMKPIIKEYTRDEVLSLEKKYLEYAALINVEEAYKPEPSILCEHCDYLDLCVEGANFLAKIGRSKPNPGQVISWDKL